MSVTAIIDYGVGNLMSISNALDFVGCKSIITCDAKEIEKADSIILPGVGAFPDAAEKLRLSGLNKVLDVQKEVKPVLGICLGMQLLLSNSEEITLSEGLGYIPGTVKQIPTQLKLPHIGWNSLRLQNDSPLFKNIDEGSYVYFVHSFCAFADDEANVIARTDYGADVVAAISKGNVFGTQFHPEKSGDVGLEILRNFGDMNR